MSSSSRGAEPDLALLPNWLGDVVMAIPALAYLKAQAPLVVVGAPALVDLVRDLGLADHSIEYERRGRDRGPQGLWRAARRCARTHPHRAFVFPPSLRAALLAFLSRARRRRGHPTDGRAIFLNERVPLPRPSRSKHQADVWLAMAQGTPVKEGAARARVEAGERGRAEWTRLRESIGKELAPKAFVVFAPGATFGPAKRWPLKSFMELAQRIPEILGGPLVVVGSGVAEEAEVCGTLAAAAGGIDLSGRTSLPGLAAVLADAALFVGNDSGPAQLAAAMGTPTVTVFGSTSPRWTAPRGRSTRVAGPHPVPCTPCFQRDCSIGLPCLQQLAVDEVWAAVVEVMEQ